MTTHDAAEAMQARLRADLKDAMRRKAMSEVATLRVCIAAIDNAQALPMAEAHKTYEVKAFGDGSAEMPRLFLDEAQVLEILRTEMEGRETAARQFEQHGETARAAALRDDAQLIARYLTAG